MKNPWSERWAFVKDYIPNNVSIVDFGCGNKEVLDYITPSRYVGVDQVSSADIIANLDSDFLLDEKFDVALLLGVLEYVNSPEQTLSKIVTTSDHFVVLSLVIGKQKAEWKRVFTKQSVDQLLHKYFSTVEHHAHGRYILSVCKK